jgi:site-specific recombinase XerC
VKWSPSFECHVRPDGERVYRIGHQLVDEFLEFVVGRARQNTVRAYAHDLSVFFTVVGKDPLEIRPKDVMAFVTAQRRPKPGAENVVRIADGSAGLSAATIKRRLAALSSFYGYLVVTASLTVCQSQASSAATSETVRPPPTCLVAHLAARVVRRQLLAAMRWSSIVQVPFAQRGSTQRIRCFFQASDIGTP